MPACNGDTHIYKTTYKGVTTTFYLSGIGSAVASSQCHLASWLTGASKFIMFGSCVSSLMALRMVSELHVRKVG